MLTVFATAAVLASIGWALGRAPLFRLLVYGLLPLAFGTLAIGWWALWVAFDLKRLVRFLGPELEPWAGVALVLLPPLLLLGWWIRGVRRRGWPGFMQRLAARPALWPLPRILMVQIGVLLLWIGGGNLLASWHEQRAERAWSGAGQAFPSLAARYPKGPTNPAGLATAHLAAALGIAISRDAKRADLENAMSHDRVEREIADYVWGEAKRSTASSVAPPVAVRAWLAMSEPRLDALERQLSSGGPVEWETDIDEWRPFPLAGVRDLHLALIASSLEAAHGGQASRASRRLEAAWRLTHSLRDRPWTSARLLAVVQDRHWLGALRAGVPARDEVKTQLEVLGDPARPLGALAVEARSFLEDARGPRTTLRGMFLEGNLASGLIEQRPLPLPSAVFMVLSGGGVSMQSLSGAIETERARARSPFYRLIQGPLEKPYLRLCAADFARAVQAERARVLAAKDPCAPVLDPPADAAPRLAPWNLVGEGSVSADRLAHTLAKLAAEAELTGHVLQARALRARDPRQGWPVELTGLESVACSGRRWVYEVSADGTASLRLAESPFAEQEATVAYRMGAP